jgi:hypothetical protein
MVRSLYFSLPLTVYIALTLCSFASPAQSNLQTLTKHFQGYTTQYLQEKIYVHIDRADHVTGEILWFKMYCVDARIHQGLDISQIAYAEILDQDNNPVLQTKVGLKNGIGAGSFFIPATIPTGTYQFRAYTNWMKNSGPEFFFQQPINIVNTLKANEPTASSVRINSMDIQFFPEGGQLVETLTSRVAFKATNENGGGVDGVVAVLNQANDTIAKERSLKFGMGQFFFTPRPGHSYRAVFKDTKGRSIQALLPSANKSGYTLMVSDTLDGKLKVRVSGSEERMDVTLLVHTRQSIKIAEARNSDRGRVVFIVDTEKLAEGISHFTVFDNTNTPVCERLYFKKPSQWLQLEVKPDQKEYGTRRKVQVSIQSNSPQAGNFSVSVFRGDSLSSKKNIVSHLFLSSDLAGEVESPWYYFSDDPLATPAADNLMLTHGWRRFNWSSVVTGKAPITHLPELKGHLIQGRIVDSFGKPAVGKVGYLASPGKKIRLYVAKSDTAGRVRFQMKDFQETGKIIAQTNYELDSLCHIEIESPFSREYTMWKARSIPLNPLLEDDLIDRSVAMQVQDAFYEDETYFQFTRLNVDSIPFYGKADEVYNLDDYTRFPVMEEVMREYVKGVWVRKKRDTFRFMVLDKQKNEVFQNNPLTLLDGVPVFNINQVLDIEPLKIKKVEVLTRKYFLGPLELSGIVSYSTYNGDLGGFELDPRSIALDYEGLQRQREFYSPKYSDPALRSSRLPDQRYQLYWSADVSLDSSKPATLEFYTSDVEGGFIVIVEGLSKNGIPGSSTSTFKVSR